MEDAGGYKGYPKCNLFAFELVRRAGYTVPVRARAHGWSYPGADAVARMAKEGETGGWGIVRTADDAAQLDATALSGVPLVLASAADGGAVGHMAVADRIHDIKRDAEGNITSLEYSGWDAASRGSRYARRIWRVAGVSGEGRGGLSDIQILQPTVAGGEGAQFVPLGGRPGASIQDASRISTDPAQERVSKTDLIIEDVSGVLDEASEAPK